MGLCQEHLINRNQTFKHGMLSIVKLYNEYKYVKHYFKVVQIGFYLFILRQYLFI